MTLKKCRECKAEVSISFKVCPKCGIENPTSMSGVVKLSLVLGVLTVFAMFASLSDNSASYNSQPVAEKETRPECLVRKANGQLDPRECDLVELCADKKFYQRKVYEAETVDEMYEAQKSLNKTLAWLAEYRIEDQSSVCSGRYELLAVVDDAEVNKPSAESKSKDVAVEKNLQIFACDKDPAKIFSVGKIYEADEFSKIVDGNCPDASVDQDGEASLLWSGTVYTLLAQVLPSGDGAKKIMVSSVSKK